MKTILAVLCALVLLAVVADQAQAARRGGGMGGGMVCNVNVVPAPPAATAQNLTPTTALRVIDPLRFENAEPVMLAGKASKVAADPKFLQALNADPATRKAISNIAAK